MTPSEQMSFGFDSAAQQAAESALTKPPSRPRKSSMPGAAPGAGKEAAEPLSHESMAQALERHADYKVLRRLVPRDHWGAVGSGTTQRVIVLDTETTGLDAKAERIIELALLSVLVDTNSGLPVGEVTTYESFEDPGKPIAPAITEITGINDSMVHGQRIDDVRVSDLVQSADLVIAHNAGFDRPFVEARLPVFAHCAWNCSWAGIDWKAQGCGSAKLESLAHGQGWFYDAHRALVDCHALLQVLTARLNNGQTGLQRLLHGAQETRYKLRAVGAPFEAKDALKARGYRWDKDNRVWWSTFVGEAALQQEADWLKAHAYSGRRACVQIEAQTAFEQFSVRTGQVSERWL